MCHEKKSSSLVMSIIAALVFGLVMAVFGTSQAAGLLKPATGDQNQISIKSHNVRVVINNGYARTEVDQMFVNTADRDLEAVYSFPLPHQASLSELSLWIDGQEVLGEVLEKQRAEQVYEEQKSKGNDTALAQKKDYKTFDLNVYPVKATEPTRVRLVYYQPLEIDLNVGRYVYPLEEGGVDEERLSFWSIDSEVKESFSFDLVLKSTQPIKDIRLPGHPQAQIEKIVAAENEENGNGHRYRVKLDYPEGATLSKDIIFYYRLDDSVPARVEFVAYKEAEAPTGTFMLTVTPGASLAPISEGTDWVFVLDRSGSMGGLKINTLTDGVSRVINKMSPANRFRVVTFNDQAEDLTNGFVPATPEEAQKAITLVKGITAEKGTALHAGIELGLKKMDSERTTAVVLVTDGVANIGPQAHAEFVDLIKAQDVRFFTFVMGNSANRPLLDRIARASGGFALDVSMSDDIYGRILQAKSKVLYEALHDVQVSFSGIKTSDITPVHHKTLYQGQQLILFGHYHKPGTVDISVEAKISGQSHQWTTQATFPDEDTENPEIERLWALSAVEDIMTEIDLKGESEKLRQEVVGIGEQYSIVTDYTSMVVLDEQEMEGYGIQRNNSNRSLRERTAQHQRSAGPVKNYRVDNKQSGGTFKGAKSPGIGSGPVGPWFLALIFGCAVLVRRKVSSSKNRGN